MSNYPRKQNKISKSIAPSKELIKELYSEEVFDCIKSEIAKHTHTQKEDQRHEKKLARKAAIREERERLRDVLIARYGEDAFKRFNSKNKRKAIRSELTEPEVHALKYWANQWKEKIRQANRRAARKTRNGTRTKYDLYINSKEWERRRNLYWQAHPKRCEICLTASFIHLHHMSYEKLGREPDEHLVALCSTHHANYHTTNGVQRRMIRKTHAYIEEEKGKLNEIQRSKSQSVGASEEDMLCKKP